MDAALLFLIVFLAYTVLVVVALMRVRQLAADAQSMERTIDELRSVLLTQGRIVHDVADSQTQQVVLPEGDTDMQDLQSLLSNPLVQQMMSKE